MSKQFIISNLAFANAAESLQGRLPFSHFERFRSMLEQPEGEVDFSVSGGNQSLGYPHLRLGVSTSISLRCQRCLQSFWYPLASSVVVRIASDENELNVLDQGPEEAVLADPSFDLLMFIEDELLLALPIIARHENCQPAWRAATERNNPFLALAQLRRSPFSR